MLQIQLKRFIFAVIVLFISAFTPIVNSAVFPARIQLGMNGVPVMDQGWEWGNCVTFAVTAALNALHGWHGDNQISSVCYMQMTRSFSDDIDQSAWNDGDPIQTLLMFNHFGVWTINDQKSLHIDGHPACGGIINYPFTSGKSDFIYSPTIDIDNIDNYIRLQKEQRVKDGGAGESMSVGDFEKYSRHLIKNEDWHLLEHRIDQNPEQALLDIKKALNHGNRIIVAIKMDIMLQDHGKNLGAVGIYHNQAGDTWIMTPQIMEHITKKMSFPSHAIIITGYDDDAQVSGQKGLITVRNSIGEKMGDHGDFYITYDYFYKMIYPGFPIAIGS